MELTCGPKERVRSRTTLRWSHGGGGNGERDGSGLVAGRFGPYEEELCLLFLEVETLPVWSERPPLLPQHES